MKLTNNSLARKLSRTSRGDIMLLVAAATVLIGLFLMVALSRASVAQALALSTSRQPEAYTELYFNNPNTLPKHITAGVPATISFHIANHETQTMVYRARVSLVENGRVKPLIDTTYTLGDNHSLDIPVTFTTAKPATNLELIIELPNQTETIHFRSQS